VTTSPSKHYSGHCTTTEEDGDPKTPGKEIWRRKCGQQASGTAGGSQRQQLKSGVEWSVTCEDMLRPGSDKA